MGAPRALKQPRRILGYGKARLPGLRPLGARSLHILGLPSARPADRRGSRAEGEQVEKTFGSRNAGGWKQDLAALPSEQLFVAYYSVTHEGSRLGDVRCEERTDLCRVRSHELLHGARPYSVTRSVDTVPASVEENVPEGPRRRVMCRRALSHRACLEARKGPHREIERVRYPFPGRCGYAYTGKGTRPAAHNHSRQIAALYAGIVQRRTDPGDQVSSVAELRV